MTDFRSEKPGDEPAIRYVNEQAFAGPDEANLIDALRNRNAFTLGNWLATAADCSGQMPAA
ncbi:MAG TPA: hypothetical protein VMW16_03580 [Sedimentisphaerales bacterium]|nr:hypothetical protein [Sedimentisphaerales bacterium]